VFIVKINQKLFENDDYINILDGILKILTINNESEEIKLFLLEILKPWATKFIQLSEKKVHKFNI
jgi:hypothetical protein